MYNPRESIMRDKSTKKRPVTSLVDSKWNRPAGKENASNMNRSFRSSKSQSITNLKKVPTTSSKIFSRKMPKQVKKKEIADLDILPSSINLNTSASSSKKDKVNFKAIQKLQDRRNRVLRSNKLNKSAIAPKKSALSM